MAIAHCRDSRVVSVQYGCPANFHSFNKLSLGGSNIFDRTEMLDMDGQNGVVASELATVAIVTGQLEIAQRALRTVTMLKPTGTQPATAGTAAPMSKALAYQYLAEIARQQGDRKRAILMAKRAVDDDPALLSAKALLDALHAEE